MPLIAMGGNCPNCNGKLEYLGKGKVVCPFCDAQFFDEEAAKMDTANEAEDNEPKEKTEEEIDEIVRKAIRNYPDKDGYGVQISLDDAPLSKERKARKNFDIYDEDTIYMIYDETMFGSCKDGYALTDAGLYFSYAECGDVFIPWEEFYEVDIDYGDDDTELYIDDDLLEITGTDACENTYNLLTEIQDKLCE